MIKARTYALKIFFTCAVLITAYSLLCSPAGARGATEGVYSAVFYVMPSLFPMMVLSAFTLNSPVKNVLIRLLGGITYRIFNCPKEYSHFMLFSLFGGYPIGASMIGEALKKEQISKKNASKLLCMTVNAGVGFTVAVVGITLLGNVALGWMLYCSHILSLIILSRVIRFTPATKTAPARSRSMPYAQAFTNAVLSGAYGCIHILAFMGVFSSILSMLSETFFFDYLSLFLSSASRMKLFDYSAVSALMHGTFEVSAGAISALNVHKQILLPLLAFILGFSGLSVIAQVTALTDNKLSMLPFLLSRVFLAFSSATITLVLQRIFPEALAVGGFSTPPIMHYNSSTTLLSLCMLSMCFMVLFSFSLAMNE